ncbi:MAG: hypothetical protein CMH30_02675 [Micavibrio sp.]|nr:hypothetical protein [Micavibrio sp.]|tara:strand:- start:112 stop:930 length:819 start_codon:yes stop_codon:yes gene_type:complete
MRAFFIAVFLLSFLSLPVWAADNEHRAYDRIMQSNEIKCGYAVWPPFVEKDPNTGEMSGILVDIVGEIGKSLDLKINWAYETGYGTYTEDLNTNRMDVMCATLWADAGRIRNSLLIDPFLYSGVYLVVKDGDDRFNDDFSKLNSEEYTIAGIEGDITQTLANRLFPKAKKITLTNISQASELAENVKTGKADATFSDLGFFNDYNLKNPNTVKVLTNNPAWIFGERMAVKNGETKLKYLLDTAISELVNSGKIDEIIKKYPDTSTMPPKKSY